MELIDEDGQLFGVVNVIDVLAVLLVLAVFVAGIALVNPFASVDEATRYATLDLGEQRSYVASQISAGDVMVPENAPRNVTVTDVYTTTGDGVNASVVVRVRINGTIEDRPNRPGQAFTYAGSSIQQGNTFTLDTPDYTAAGTITRLDTSGTDLDTTTTTARIEATVTPATARQIERGDNIVVVDQPVATITDVRVGPGSNESNRHVLLGVELNTIRRVNGLSFGGTPLAVDRSIGLDGPAYSLQGQIDTLETDAIETRSTKVGIETTVSRSIADSITPGDTFTVAGRPVATVRSVDVYPSSGQTSQRAVIGLDLRTVQKNGGQYFGSAEITLGTTIPFGSSGYRLSGQVISHGSYSPPGTSTSRTMTVKIENAPPEFVDGIRVGMAEQNGGQTTVRVVDKRVQPASVILTSEQGDIFERTHPRNKDVYLTLEAQVRETNSGLEFHSRALEEGNTVTLDFRTLTVRGTVVDIQPAD